MNPHVALTLIALLAGVSFESQARSPEILHLKSSLSINAPPSAALLNVVALYLNTYVSHPIPTNLPISSSNNSAFWSTEVPSISVKKYIKRLQSKLNIHDSTVWIMVLHYANLFHNPTNANPLQSINKYTVHRFIVTAVLVADKVINDFPMKNSFVARSGGIKLEEINYLEVQFARILNWKLQCVPESMNHLWEQILAADKWLSIRGQHILPVKNYQQHFSFINPTRN